MLPITHLPSSNLFVVRCAEYRCQETLEAAMLGELIRQGSSMVKKNYKELS
jgi:hypothetical protein